MIDSKQVCILFLGDSSHPMKKTYPTTPRERPSTAPPTAAPQAPRARPVGVRSAGTQIFANKKKHPRKVAMWEKTSRYNTYLPGSCECLSLFWCFTKGPRFQLKQGSFGKHAKDTQVLNKGKTQDLIELIAVITRGCIASGNVIPCRRWKLARCCGGI